MPKKCWRRFTLSTAIFSPSDTTYGKLSTIIYSKVCTSCITKLLSHDTCSWNYTPPFNKPQSPLAMLNSVTSSPSWVWFKWHSHFCKIHYCHMCYTVPAFCSGTWPIQNIYHCEWCIMKQLVINHTNSFLTSCLW